MAVGLRWCLSLVLLCLMVLAAVAKDPLAPRAQHAKTYPAREERPNEKVTLAVDPYDLEDKAEVFSTNYLRHGLMPVQLIISNDGEQPVSLAGMQVELITVRRVRIRPAEQDDLYRRLSRPGRGVNSPPVPIPGRRSGPRPSMRRQVVEEIEQLKFRARAVEPHGTQHGFLFFDVEGIENPLAGARLYVSGIRDGDGEEMFFFEIPMEKYLTYRPN